MLLGAMLVGWLVWPCGLGGPVVVRRHNVRGVRNGFGAVNVGKCTDCKGPKREPELRGAGGMRCGMRQ